MHVGLRTPRELDEPLRAVAEAGAALASGRLALAARARRWIHVSTAGVYGRPRNLPCREGELKAPRTVNERVRWHAEQASWSLFRRGAPLTVLRPALLYGPTLRGGPVRALAFVALLNQGRRNIPIIRGPVAHLVHLEDLGRSVVHVLRHPEDRDVVGRAFNVADEAPLPLAEHVAGAVEALGYRPGRPHSASPGLRFLLSLPRVPSALLWLMRHLPDRVLVDPVNRRLLAGWRRAVPGAGALWPRIDREALHWMSADHYYDTSRLAALGWRPVHPVSSVALPDVIRALVASRLFPPGRAASLSA